MIRKLILLFSASLALSLSTLSGNAVEPAGGAGNSWQRLRFPWPDDGTQPTVNRSVNTATHTGSDAYAIDWGLSFRSLVLASGQGDIVQISADTTSTAGLGAFVTQAVGTLEGVKYITYAHLCQLDRIGGTLFQGRLLGRSGNSGQVEPTPSTACGGDASGAHLHFRMTNVLTPAGAADAFQFGGASADTRVSQHVASSADATVIGALPVGHKDFSNNAPPGAQFGGVGNLPLDTFLQSEYINRGGLNYGSTKALDASNFAPCSNSTRWVHGCSFGFPFGFSSGVAQTFEGPSADGFRQKAFMRRSGFTSVFSVEGSILFAFNDWSTTLGYPLNNKSGFPTIRQDFEGGFIQYTTSPCQTQVFRNTVGTFVQTYGGVCN